MRAKTGNGTRGQRVGSSFPIVPAGSDQPAERRGGALQPGGPPIHQAGEMSLSSEEKLRQECWESIGGRTRERLMDLAGGVVEWFAHRDSSDPDGRPYAVVFGDRGLSIAEPRINAEHHPVYAISAYLLEPGSLRHVPVEHRPPRHAATAPPGSISASSGPQVDDLGLGPADRALLGNLPPQVQELLQAPFSSARPVRRCHWSYEGVEHRLNMFMLCLAGSRDVTVATGTKVVPAGHTDATAHWSLTCYRASVARRIGT